MHCATTRVDEAFAAWQAPYGVCSPLGGAGGKQYATRDDFRPLLSGGAAVMQGPVLEGFPPLFGRAALASVEAERLVVRSTAAVTRARATLASTRRLRDLAQETRDHWVNADAAFRFMRRQVETAARALRNSGVASHDAAARVRQRVRFVLYDGGFREVEVEPVVERATVWVDEVFLAA
jgi:hypothetical protein